MKSRAGVRIIESLAAAGVDTLFGIPGDHTLEFWRGVNCHPQVRAVVPRHEQGAGFMADGYARVSGRYGVCLIITGPGVTNAITPLAQAYSDSSPVLALSSQNRAAEAESGRGNLHEIRDQRGCVAGALAWSRRVTAPDQWQAAFSQALAEFATARPRPVHIEVPIDVLEASWPEAALTPATPPPPAPDPGMVRAAAERMAGARRPVMILGGGAWRAAGPLRALAERLGVMVFHTVAGKGTVPEDHPLCVGAALSDPAAHRMLREADVALAVGTELAPTDMWAGPVPMPDELIYIDLDPDNFGRNYRPSLGLRADARLAVEALLELITAPPGPERGLVARQAVADYRAEVAARPGSDKVRALQALRAALPRDAIVAGDMTTIGYAATLHFPCYHPRTWLFPTGYGTLGFALPAAIGAKLAAPDRQVVALAGDGGFLFTCQELVTAVELKLPLPVLVYNNGGYGQIAEGMVARGIRPVGVSLATPDFPALARACGAQGHRLTDLAELPELLARAFTYPGPTLIEIPAE